MNDEPTGRSDALLLDAVLGPLAESLRQVSLPLHILLENRFGELNENQVEMIAAARDSAESADVQLRLAQRIRALEGRPQVDRQETTRPLDLCRGPIAIASGREISRAVRCEMDLSPALPRVRGDRAHLEEALTLVITGCAARAPEGGHLVLSGGADEGTVTLTVRHGGAAPRESLERLLAIRLLAAEGARLVEDAEVTTVAIPR